MNYRNNLADFWINQVFWNKMLIFVISLLALVRHSTTQGLFIRLGSRYGSVKLKFLPRFIR